MDPQTKMIIDVIDRLGLLGFLVVFGVVFCWKYLPTLMRKWKAQAEQARIVSESIPDIKLSLSRMAEGNEMLQEILETTRRVDANVAILMGRN